MATRTRMLTLNEVVAAARRLSPRDQLRLIERLAAELEPSVSAEVPAGQAVPPDRAVAVDTASGQTEPADAPPDRPVSGPSLYGLWADLGIELSEDELRQLRREAWSGLGEREV